MTNTTIEMSDATLTHEEARVLAALMEKQLTTPKNYPLTLNSLMLACNQKSNREPVMKLMEGQVGKLVNTLADRDLTSIEYGDRANRIFHKMRGAFSLDQSQQAVLTVLMLRKPQTLNDIKTRTTRMADFSSNAEIVEILEEFMSRETPLAICLAKGNGRREDRYTHLLCGEVDEETIAVETPANTVKFNEKVEHDKKEDFLLRISKLEDRLDALEKALQLTSP